MPSENDDPESHFLKDTSWKKTYVEEEVNAHRQPPYDKDDEQQPRMDAIQPSDADELTEDA